MNPKREHRIILLLLLLILSQTTFVLQVHCFLGNTTTNAKVRNATEYFSIQDAIDRLPQSGGTVLIPSGIYIVSTPIKVSSNVHLKGAGLSTCLKLADGANCNVIQNVNPRLWIDENITITNMQIDGNKATQTAPCNGIFLCEAPNSRIEHLWIHNFPRSTVSAGILLLFSSNCTISHNLIENNSYAGIFVGCSDNCIISSNRLFDNHRGIYVSRSDNTLVTRNRIVNCDEGIRLYGDASNNMVIGNHIKDSSDEGILIMHPECTNNFLIKNKLINDATPINDGGTDTELIKNKII